MTAGRHAAGVLAVLAVLAACAGGPELRAEGGAVPAVQTRVAASGAAVPGRKAPVAALAPYEAAEWPRYLRALELPRGRDYVVVSYLPPALAVDLQTPETMRRTLLEGLSQPFASAQARTKLGHAIIAWQCGPAQGVTSHSGESNGQALAMMLSGWGLVPVFSTFEDGYLYTEAGFNPRHDLAFRAGKGVVTAVEVSRARCEALRGALRGFVTHPARPVRRFGLTLAPDRFEGAGCLSFAWYLGAAAGVIGDLEPLFRREVELRAAQLGAGPVPPGVVPWRPPAGGAAARVGVAALLGARWDQGAPVERVSVPDGEAFLAALVAMRAGLAGPDDWRPARVLPSSDPMIARAATAGARFAAGFARRRIADPGGVSALVLERD